HQRLFQRAEALVQAHQALEVAGRGAHVHRLAGEVVDGGELGRGGPRDHYLGDALHYRVGEVDALRALGGDGQVTCSQVAAALQQPRQQQLARGGQRDDGDRPVLELVLLVEEQLEFLERV